MLVSLCRQLGAVRSSAELACLLNLQHTLELATHIKGCPSLWFVHQQCRTVPYVRLMRP